jgi:hypothetical protein
MNAFTPARRKAPSTKHQAPDKLQAPNLNDHKCTLAFRSVIRCELQSLGAWNLVVIWSLVVGIWSFSCSGADPRTNSWLTTYSAKYARIVETDAQLAAGTNETTWSRNSISQPLPTYCGVQEIYSSDGWVYIRSTGLGSHLMGPWYNDGTRTTLFVNIPANQKALVRFPRFPTIPNTKSAVQGQGGYFVDGVIMFDSSDAVSYINSTSQDGSPPGGSGSTGDGIWNRDAYMNEAITFDPAIAHQQNTGVYHYHANPIATRYLLGDHVDFNSSTKTYSESTNAPTRHSPIVGWANDGFPIYGPYGYSSASNSASGSRRMISGYVLRTGQFGTSNLAVTGRTTLPAWAARISNRSTTLSPTEYGPNVTNTFPLGRYLEDNDYLGDFGYTQGVQFDLDEYNGRFCVTPDFPGGTYAYFVAISSNGAPAFPYNLGRRYYGDPTGAGAVGAISEAVVTNFLGGANLRETMNAPSRSGNNIVLKWSGIEGGTYRIEAKSSLAVSNWTGILTNTVSGSASGSATETNGAANPVRFYRLDRTALANYDPVTGTGGGVATITMSPTSGNRGTTFTVTATISASASPPVPPISGAPVQVFTIGTMNVTGASYTYNSGSGIVTGSLSIPGGYTPTGGQTVTITFAPPPMGGQAPSYTQVNGFTVN